MSLDCLRPLADDLVAEDRVIGKRLVRFAHIKILQKIRTSNTSLPGNLAGYSRVAPPDARGINSVEDHRQVRRINLDMADRRGRHGGKANACFNRLCQSAYPSTSQ